MILKCRIIISLLLLQEDREGFLVTSSHDKRQHAVAPTSARQAKTKRPDIKGKIKPIQNKQTNQ